MPALAQKTWTIPGTVNASGLNGTKFVSDLAITNPGTAPVLASLALVPANGTASATALLNPGQTIVDRNLLQQVFSASGAAATVVTSSAPLLIRARTYNTAASGTYGVALPVVADDRMLSPGDTGDSLWIAQSGDGSTGYRTNVAVVFPDADRTCQGQTGTTDTRKGKSDHTGDLVLGPGGAEHKTPANDNMNYEKWTLRPVSPCSQ